MFTCNFTVLFCEKEKNRTGGLKSFVIAVSAFGTPLLNTNPRAVIQIPFPLRDNTRLLCNYVTAIGIVSIYSACED